MKKNKSAMQRPWPGAFLPTSFSPGCWYFAKAIELKAPKVLATLFREVFPVYQIARRGQRKYDFSQLSDPCENPIRSWAERFNLFRVDGIYRPFKVLAFITLEHWYTAGQPSWRWHNLELACRHASAAFASLYATPLKGNFNLSDYNFNLPDYKLPKTPFRIWHETRDEAKVRLHRHFEKYAKTVLNK